MTNNRLTPEYKSWRLSVLKRDKFQCKKCGTKKKKLYTHHIKSWASSPQLRYLLSNGITLCYLCHKSITGNELSYERLCYTLISGQNLMNRLRKDLYEQKNEI